jgi:hypothetical protein
MTKTIAAIDDNNARINEKVQVFLNSYRQILSEIENWSQSIGLKIIKGKTEISEEVAGKYAAPILTLVDDKKREIAIVRPIGAFIIGASGRFDIEGSLDKESIILMGKGGTTFEFAVSKGQTVLEKSKTSLFKGIDKDGWYWIESKKLARAKLLDKDLFFDLIRGVSDYEF